ncbi:ankyrin repeat-containing domain protein [Hypoxylon sp. FL1857]|nr:ankyrin repeat-containing domain protein [Hypoxylon sp. FL1857]
MASRYNFHATESQYRTQFNRWGTEWNKNRKTTDYENLAILISHRRNCGKESVIYEWGKLLSKEDRKRIEKSNPKTLQRLRPIVVRTPIQDHPPGLADDLPSLQIEYFIYEQFLSGPINHTSINPLLLGDRETIQSCAMEEASGLQSRVDQACQRLANIYPAFFATNTSVLNVLASVVPCLTYQERIAPQLYRQVLHSAINNFAGFGSCSSGQLLQFLNETSGTNLYPLILPPLGNSTCSNTYIEYYIRSIAQSFLKGAIEIGDAATTHAILSNNSLGIEIDEPICFIGSRRYTPTERASNLQHRRIIEIMLDYGADVNKTYRCYGCTCIKIPLRYCPFGPHGALGHALTCNTDPEIINILLGAGSHISFVTLSLLSLRGYDNLVSLIVQQRGPECHKEWAKGEGFVDAHRCSDTSLSYSAIEANWETVFNSLDEKTSLHILNGLGEVEFSKLCDILNVAIAKGYPKLFEALLERGARPFERNFDLIIGNENEDVFRLLLSHMRIHDSDDEDWGTNEHDMFIRAIEKGSKRLVQILLDHGFIPNIQSLHSAVDTGDEELVRLILNSQTWMRSKLWSLHSLLDVAINKQHTQISDLLKGLIRNDFEVFCTQWKRAIHDGDIGLILDLAQGRLLKEIALDDSGGTIRALESALGRAAVIGDKDAAMVLLDTIVYLGGWHRGTCSEALYHAVQGNNVVIVELFLDYGADPNTMTNPNYSPKRMEPKSRFEPEFYDPIDCRRELPCYKNLHEYHYDWEPIVHAAKAGNHSMVETLLAAGATPTLLGAVLGSHVDLAQILYDAGAVVSTQDIEATVQLGDLHMIEWMITRGLDVNCAVLQLALDNLHIVELCLSHGAAPHIHSDTLAKASMSNRKVFEALLQACRKSKNTIPPKGFASAVLCHAISRCDEFETKYLLDHGADPNGPVCSRNMRYMGQVISSFGYAIGMDQSSSISMVEMMLGKGCDPNSIVSEIKQDRILVLKNTALLTAVDTRNVKMARLLITKGADVNPPTRGLIKRTPLQRAAEIGCYEMVELLDNLDADINAPAMNNGGATALQLAAIGGYNRIVRYLLSRKAKVDAPAAKINGMTALEGAASNGRLETAYILLKAGAGAGGEDKAQFEKAIAMANENGHSPTADMLQEYLESSVTHRGPGDIAMSDYFEEFVNSDGCS